MYLGGEFMHAIIMTYHVLFSSVIRKTMESRLDKYGFRYAGKGPNGWLFRRNKENVIETVAIMLKLEYYSELRMELYTNVLGTISSCIDAEIIREIDDLQETLESFCDTFESRGELILSKMHKPHLKTFPPEELRIYLYENKELIYNRCADKEDFPIDDFKKVYVKIAEELKTMKDKPYDENAKKRLMELTVILGNAEIKRFGWKWRWRKKKNWPDITTKMNKFRDNPLINIFTTYSNQRIDDFIDEYESYEKRYK